MSELADPGAWQDQDVLSVERRRLRRPLAYLRRIFTEPFLSDPEQLLQLPIPVRERRRRAALLRLFRPTPLLSRLMSVSPDA